MYIFHNDGHQKRSHAVYSRTRAPYDVHVLSYLRTHFNKK